LPEVLEAWLPQQRWFAGQGVPIDRLVGYCVSPGYWRRADDRLSARLADAQPPGATPGQRFLRSGELVFCRDGELYVLGRPGGASAGGSDR
jgi:hypothetical protein